MAKKIAIGIVLIGLIVILSQYTGEYLNLAAIKARQAEFAQYYRDNPFLVLPAYFAIYVAVTSLSLPGAAILTLVAGALFGVIVGTILVSFASSIGATCAFFVARYLVGNTLQQKYGDKLAKINEGVRKEGGFYLLALRLIPAFPFFLINILMALTPMKARLFYMISQIGMLPGTIVFVNAGTQLAEIDSLKGLLSPALIGSFVLLGILPIAQKKIIEHIRKRRAAAS